MDYLDVRIVSTVLFFIGAISNALVVYLCHRAMKSERKSFLLLIQIVCVSNIVNTMAGWTVLNRCDQLEFYLVCVSYGLGMFLPPRVIHLLDCLVIFIDTYVPFLISLMMLFRTLILFDNQFKTRTLVIATAFIIMAALPQMYGPVIGFVPISDVVGLLNPALQLETAQLTSYAMTMDEINLLIWYVYDKIPIGCFLVCIFLRFLMQWKLRYFKETISKRIQKIHSGFMNLLTLDAFVILIYYIGSQTGFFAGSSTSVMTFHYPLFTLPSIVQSFSLLYFVPYLNKFFVRYFKKTESTVIVTSTRHD